VTGAGTTTVSGYLDLLHTLHEIDAERAEAVARLDHVHGVRTELAGRTVTRAEHEVDAAEVSVSMARHDAEVIDQRAAMLWTEMRRLLGRRGRGLDPLPRPDAVPAGEVPGPDEIEAAHVRLDRAAETIRRSALGYPLTSVPPGLHGLLPPAGAVLTLLIQLPIRVLMAVAGHAYASVHVIGVILLVLSPLAGVPVLRFWVRHRYDARPDITAAGLTVLGGVIAACAMAWTSG
jgi:hypothetical protein